MTLYQRSVNTPHLPLMPEFGTQGDLTELLGEVPVYKSERPDDTSLTSIPPLPADGNHPYHLVVMYFLPFPTNTRKF